ncbi:MAG TPA: hypothetical protein VK177_17920 [Flavobacteriales bacterium]|nr:hypothetical protein [Flavobacteriales bacterium]
MKHPPLKISDILSKKEYAYFTQKQAQEFIESINILCEIMYSAIKQNFSLFKTEGANLNALKDLVYLEKAA